MFDLNKRTSAKEPPELPDTEPRLPERRQETSSPSSSSSGSGTRVREAAIIGPSIHIEGDLRGEEDLIIEGEVKGRIHLADHGLTVGSKGKIQADVYAHTIVVDGSLEGDLYGAERVSIRKTGQVKGNIVSPRVNLEDGGDFKGSVEMDEEAVAKIFGRTPGQQRSESAGGAQQSQAAASSQPSSGASSSSQTSGTSADTRQGSGTSGSGSSASSSSKPGSGQGESPKGGSQSGKGSATG